MTRIPSSCQFQVPLEAIEDAHHFFAMELTSERIVNKIERWGNHFPWILDDKNVFFELTLDPPKSFTNILYICSKIYIRGVILISMYFEGVFYLLLRDGNCDLPLLDINFPDISPNSEGIALMLYENERDANKNKNKNRKGLVWKKLSIWKSNDTMDPRSSFDPSSSISVKKDLSSSSYIHTYCILRPRETNDLTKRTGKNIGNSMKDEKRPVFFRFGNWCYSGEVDLISDLSIVDIPFVIPIIRSQQKELKYVCDISDLPCNNPFASAVAYSEKVTRAMEQEVLNSEDNLIKLMNQLSLIGLENSAKKWIDGDPNKSFFEFTINSSEDCCKELNNVDLLAVKRYDPNGVVTMGIYFDGSYYLSIINAESEQPLLDSEFPDVANKGRGYLVQRYPRGTVEWPQLRKMCIWQTVEGMEKEFDKSEAEKKNEKLNTNASNDLQCSKESQNKTNKNKWDSKTHEMNKEDVKDIIPRDVNTSQVSQSPPMLSSKKKTRSKTKSRKKHPNVASIQSKKISQASNEVGIGGGFLKKNLGAFHHLAPLTKSSELENRLVSIQKSTKVQDSTIRRLDGMEKL